jgi:hypothetical protein
MLTSTSTSRRRNRPASITIHVCSTFVPLGDLLRRLSTYGILTARRMSARFPLYGATTCPPYMPQQFLPIQNKYQRDIFHTGNTTDDRVCEWGVQDMDPPSRRGYLLSGASIAGNSPVLLCSGTEGTVKLYDIRTHAPVGPDLEFRCHDHALMGLAMRPSGVLATAAWSSAGGTELIFSDVRLASESGKAR